MYMGIILGIWDPNFPPIILVMSFSSVDWVMLPFPPICDLPSSCLFLRCLFYVIHTLESLPLCINYVTVFVLLFLFFFFSPIFKDAYCSAFFFDHIVHILEFLILFVFQRPGIFLKEQYINDKFSEILFCIFPLPLYLYALANYKICQNLPGKLWNYILTFNITVHNLTPSVCPSIHPSRTSF